MGLFEKSLLLLLLVAVMFSGCVGQSSSSTTNVITIDNYYVQNLKPLAGTTTMIEFEVNKKGRGTGDAIVDFFDTSGMIPLGLKCQSPADVYGTRCVLRNMVYNDNRLITLTLQAPTRSLIKSETQYKVSYYVQHDYLSESSAMITVWDGLSITKPKTTFTAGNPTDGPIQLEFSQPSSGTSKGSDIPYRKDVPFEMKITVKNIANGFISPQVIGPGRLTINKDGLMVAKSEGQILQCDFDETGSMLVSRKTATLPATFTCYLVAVDYFNSYKTYTLSASFPYTYQYKNTETFTVVPVN